jgi:hypothetical protein
MTMRDSVLDAGNLSRARVLLKTPVRRDPVWPALLAATALALASVVFAAVAVLAPPVQTQHTARGEPN